MRTSVSHAELAEALGIDPSDCELHIYTHEHRVYLSLRIHGDLDVSVQKLAHLSAMLGTFNVTAYYSHDDRQLSIEASNVDD